MGYVLGARATRASKCASGRSLKLDMFRWVIGFKVFVSRLMFHGMQFLTSRNERWVATKTQHVSMLVCSEALVTFAWKLALGHLEVSNAFMTCC
jgi:hypothetical protein